MYDRTEAVFHKVNLQIQAQVQWPIDMCSFGEKSYKKNYAFTDHLSCFGFHGN